MVSPTAAYAWGGAVAANPPYLAAAVGGVALVVGLYGLRHRIKPGASQLKSAVETFRSNA